MVQIRLTACSARVLSHFSCVWLFVAPWTIARQAPLSVGFSRQEHWSGLPCFPPGDLPDPGIESVSLLSPAFQVDSLPVTLHYPSKWLSPYQYSMNYILTPMTTYFYSEILYTTEKSWHATTEKQNKNSNTKPFPNAAFFFVTIMTAWFVPIDKFIVFVHSFLTLGKLVASVAVTFKSSIIPVSLRRCGCIRVSRSVMSDFLQSCSLPGSFLCPWYSPDKNTRVGCHCLLQGIFPTQGSNLGCPHYR